ALVVANVGDEHLDAELVEEVFDIQRLSTHAGQQDAGRVGHVDAVRRGEQQQVDEMRVLDKGVNPLPRSLEFLEGLHQLPHFGQAEPGCFALEVERRDVLIRRSFSDQVEQTLEVQQTRPKGVLRGQCVLIGTVKSKLDDGGLCGQHGSLRRTDERYGNEYGNTHRYFHGRHPTAYGSKQGNYATAVCSGSGRRWRYSCISSSI